MAHAAALLKNKEEPASRVCESGRLPLSFATPGNTVTVASVRGSGEQRAHLESLGFVEGAIVQVVSELAGSPIVEVKGARIALSRQLAQKIQVIR